jgi:hypothetical protein
MKKSHLYITLGVLAVGVAYYLYNKSKNPTTKPTVKPAPNDKSASTATAEDKSNAQGFNPRKGGSNKAPVGTIWCNRGAVEGHAWLTPAECAKARK